MSIATMEALTGASAGTRLTVGSEQRIFTVGAGTLEWNGFTVPMEHFAHEVSAGMIREGVPFQTGQWWRNRSGFRMYVVGLEQDSSAVAAEFRRDGTWRQLRRNVSDQSRWTLMDTPPDWPTLDQAIERANHEWAQSARISLLEQRVQNEQERRTRDNAALNEQQAQFKTSLSERLCAYIEEQGTEDMGGLFRIMRDFSLSVPRRNVKVTTTAKVTTMHQVTPEVTAMLIPEGTRPADNPRYRDIRVSWEKDYEHEVEVDAGQCACRYVRTSVVRQMVTEDLGITDWWDFNYESKCENCSN